MKKIMIAIALLGLTGWAHAGGGGVSGSSKAAAAGIPAGLLVSWSGAANAVVQSKSDAFDAPPPAAEPAPVVCQIQKPDIRERFTPDHPPVANEIVMLGNRLMRVYKVQNGTVLLFDTLENYLPVDAKALEREAEEGFNGFKKDEIVCLKARRVFVQETADDYMAAFSYTGEKGSRLKVLNLFKSGSARMRVVSEYYNNVLVRPVDLDLVEACGK
ncbi:MAG: hypothetical protein NTY45_08170 [Elusimicrobia bacterium]|nr:hypothetical protein [Elusimicrobiota bacterium]